MSLRPHHDTVPAQICAALDRHRDLPALGDGRLRMSYGDLAGVVAACRAVLPATGTVAVYGVPGTLFAALATACVVSGRPFVHLEPAMPDAVLENILSELDVDLVLTAERTGARPLAGRRQVAGETFLGAPAGGRVAPAQVRPGDAIYIVATSGTTGRPKCIPVTHDAAFLSYEWRETILPYRPGMVVGAYIFAIWEMFRPLRHGAEVVFPALRDLLTPRGFGAFLGGAGVSEMLFTPSFLSRILAGLDAGGAVGLPLRRIVLNGEVVEDRLVADLRLKMPRARVWNLYSICETHDVAMTELGRAAAAGAATVGRAMPHIAPVVLDDDGRSLPSGATGRLHFEGPRMLGPGYVARPEETARRFRTLPLGGRARRLYDTGDLGRVEADGRIVVLGRAAHMLKLRGYSIQTADLVAALGGVLDFSQAVPRVVHVGGHEVLAIYYTADEAQAGRNQERWGLGDGQRRVPDALARALAALLPDHCVPRHVVRLAAMPIHDVSGKLDLKALPAIKATPSGTFTGVPALAEAARILGMGPDAVDANGSFRDHGGDSLMCVELMVSLEAAYDCPVDFDWAMDLPLGRLHELLSGKTAAEAAGFSGRGILVTGATGFLGRYVLRAAHEALPPGSAIFCLVRAGRAAPAERLHALAGELGLPEGRLCLVAGRMDAPELGLGTADFEDLASRITSVVHCAATVNLALDGARMAAGTGAGLDALLDLCRHAGADLRFTSSSAVFPDRGGPYPEGPAAASPRTGYGSAKAAAESRIAASGLDAAIVRLPSLYDLATPNPGDIYETVLAASRSLGAVPEGLTFPMIDVRAAAAFLVRMPRPEGAMHVNLFAEDRVTPARQAPACPTLCRGDWLARAPLTGVERHLLDGDPDMLAADAHFDTARAMEVWQASGLGPWSSLADPAALLARRLAYQSEPAFT